MDLTHTEAVPKAHDDSSSNSFEDEQDGCVESGGGNGRQEIAGESEERLLCHRAHSCPVQVSMSNPLLLLLLFTECGSGLL